MKSSILKIFLTITFLLFSFIFSLFLGISINSIQIADLKIEKLYIKWDKKLNLSIQNIDLRNLKGEDESFSIVKLHKKLQNLKYIPTLFQTLKLPNILLKDDVKASFIFNEKEQGSFVINAQEIQLFSSIYTQNNSIFIKIKQLSFKDKNINLSGVLQLTQQNVQSKLKIDINEDASFVAHLKSSQTKLYYKIDSLKPIKSIKYIVDDLLNTPPYIREWIIDAIDMKELQINNVSGWLAYDDIENSYKNLNISADIKKLNYRYNKDVAPIKTEHTLLSFHNGKLIIEPKEAYTYKQYLGNKNIITLDFTKENIFLNILLQLKAKLNKDVLKILKAYNIDLPFLQKKGKTDTHLLLTINLNNLDVKANGKFIPTPNSLFNYVGLDITLHSATILLNNYEVTIPQMDASYENIMDANVKVKFDALTQKGIIKFYVKNIHLPETSLSKPVVAKYFIEKNNNHIKISTPSQWKVLDQNVTIEPITLPFDTEKLLLHIPTTKVTVEDYLTFFATGSRDFKTEITKLNIDITKFQYKNITLTQTVKNLHFIHDKSFYFFLKNKAKLQLEKTPFSLKNSYVSIDSDSLTLKGFLDVNNTANAKIDFHHKFKTKKAHLTLNNLIVFPPSLGKEVLRKNKTNLNLTFYNNELQLHSQELAFNFYTKKEQWFVDLLDLSKLAPYSKLLQQYKLQQGKVTLSKTSSQNYIEYNGIFQYPFEILVKHNEPINNYTFNGTYSLNNDLIALKLNKLLSLNYKQNNLQLSLKNGGINLKATLDMLDAIKEKKTKNQKNSNLKINFNAKKSYVYLSENRRALADTMWLHFGDNKTVATLQYKKGEAKFQLDDKNELYLYGSNFNDRFMNELFALSKFKGGKLNFSLVGPLNNFNGVIHFSDTILIDYKLLNNILAFINTIPSLVTFSIPGYNTNGLAVKNAYAKFTKKGDVYNFSDLYLDSKEVDILGKGTANYKKNTIDLTLNLKTDLASSISKIPVVGYIIFNGKSLSTTLKVDGKLTDPSVHSLIAQDIILAPLNIIQRTLMLPYHLLYGEDDKK